MTPIEHRIAVTRQARYFASGDLTNANEVWIVIHGYGQLAADFMIAFDALGTSTRAFVAPEALNRFYVESGGGGNHATAKVGATWMTREDRDAEMQDYIGYLNALEQEVRKPGVRLGALGFSQGVATLARWLAARSSTAAIDRVISWAGQIPGDVDLATLKSRLPQDGIDFVEGSTDTFGDWIATDAQVTRLAAAGIASRVSRFEGGHRLDTPTLRALLDR